MGERLFIFRGGVSAAGLPVILSASEGFSINLASRSDSFLTQLHTSHDIFLVPLRGKVSTRSFACAQDDGVEDRGLKPMLELGTDHVLPR